MDSPADSSEIFWFSLCQAVTLLLSGLLYYCWFGWQAIALSATTRNRGLLGPCFCCINWRSSCIDTDPCWCMCARSCLRASCAQEPPGAGSSSSKPELQPGGPHEVVLFFGIIDILQVCTGICYKERAAGREWPKVNQVCFTSPATCRRLQGGGGSHTCGHHTLK